MWAVEGCVATCVGGYDYLPKRGHTIASIPYISDLELKRYVACPLRCKMKCHEALSNPIKISGRIRIGFWIYSIDLCGLLKAVWPLVWVDMIIYLNGVIL